MWVSVSDSPGMSSPRSPHIPAFVLVLSVTSLLGVVACGEEEGAKSRVPAVGPSGPGVEDPEDDIIVPAGPGPGSSENCTTDADCSPDACHPATQTCTPLGGTCDSDADCGVGFYCNTPSGHCLTGLAGSPCTTADNCFGGGSCSGGTCGCAGFAQEQEISEGKLDIYFMFDHTSSMIGAGMAGGRGMNAGGDPALDCAYTPGTAPPVISKACSATYALSDYLIEAPSLPEADTRLALQFMSLAGENTCAGGPYAQPMTDLTQLPLDPSHPMIQAISDDDFNTANNAGDRTEIEGALRGITQYTAANKVPGREMIGVLMTDGDATQCNQDIDDLSQIIADHYATTGIRTFIIGMEGATDENLERMAREGGADPHDDFCGSLTPPCHYWNVGDASGDVLAAALQAIIGQSTPIGCEFPLTNVQPAEGQTLDPSTINVTLTTPSGGASTILNTASAADCPMGELAWYYDNPAQPSVIHFCPDTCSAVGGAEGGTQIDIVGGCEPTAVIAR